MYVPQQKLPTIDSAAFWKGGMSTAFLGSFLGASLVGSGISSALGVGGSALGSAVQNKKSYKYTKQLQDQQNQWNLEMWNRQNEYNSPASQRARLESAGLNPDLMYGQTSSTGNSNSMPSASDASFKASGPDFSSLGRIYSDSVNNALHRAQVDDIFATRDLKLQQAATERSRQSLNRSQSLLNLANQAGRLLDNKYLARTLKDRVARNTLENTLLESRDALTNSNIRSIDSQIEVNNMRIMEMGQNIMTSQTIARLNNQKTAEEAARTYTQNLLNQYFYEKGVVPNSSTLSQIIGLLGSATEGAPGNVKDLILTGAKKAFKLTVDHLKFRPGIGVPTPDFSNH
ncbi:DNA pilot protein [Dipodfec virus UOA04_Rod_999]|nr:DNA pilot protein [Dipodfec virus UOA04_Rod_999]